MSDMTKDKIADTLEKLLERQSLDKITIKLLVIECGISRQSFYYYYKDILDVLEWIAHRKLEKLLDQSRNVTDYKSGIHMFIDFVFENHYFITRLLDSKHREFIEQLLVSSLRSFLENILRILLQRKEPLSFNYFDIDAILDFCTYGLAGLLLEASKNKNTDKEVLGRQMQDLLLKVLT